MTKLNTELVKRALELGTPLHEIANRSTGRSTAIALEALARALDSPWTKITVQDHHDRSEELTYQRARSLASLIEGIAVKLGLKGICVGVNDRKVEVMNKFTEVL